MKHADLSPLEQEIGHSFARRELLEQAVTHSSHAGESAPPVADNEQLEFLGDAVLGFITGEELFRRFPQQSEGNLSKMRAHLVSARHLIHVAESLQVGQYLRLGRGEEKTGGRSKSALLVDALEAIIAALYLDRGVEAARGFILSRVIGPELGRMAESARQDGLPLTDYKSHLQEVLQATGCRSPEYVVTSQLGPDHRRTFIVEARIYNRKGVCDFTVSGEGTTKKRAEQMAARAAMARMESSAATQEEA